MRGHIEATAHALSRQGMNRNGPDPKRVRRMNADGPLPKQVQAGNRSKCRRQERMPLDPAARAGVSSRRLPPGNMKPIAPLLVVLSLAVIVTGCETTRKGSCSGSSRCVNPRSRQDHQSVAEKASAGLFWLGQSALSTAANDTAQTEAPFPH